MIADPDALTALTVLLTTTSSAFPFMLGQKGVRYNQLKRVRFSLQIGLRA